MSAALRGLGIFVRAQPERREPILGWVDRRSPESEALWRRLVDEGRRRRGRVGEASARVLRRDEIVRTFGSRSPPAPS